MEQKQQFQSIFTSKINNRNIHAARKFFSADSTDVKVEKSEFSQKKQSNHYFKMPSLNRNHRARKTQFTAGFQNQNSSKFTIDGLEEAESLQSMMITSKKAPANELQSFLLGITDKINQTIQKQNEVETKQKNSDKFLSNRQIPDPANIDQVLSTIQKIKIHHKKRGQTTLKRIKNTSFGEIDLMTEVQNSTIQSPSKFSDYQSGYKQRAQIKSSKIISPDSITSKLPLLEEKKCSYGGSEQRQENNSELKSKQTPNDTKITASSARTERKPNDRENRSLKTYKGGGANKRQLDDVSGFSLYKRSSNQFLKVIDDPQRITFKKGYLAYDQKVLEILENFKEKILQFKDETKLTESDHKIYQEIRAQTKDRQRLFKDITATNYLVVDRKNFEIVLEKKSKESIQIASLTKIITCYLCLLVCRKYGVDPKSHMTRVSDRAGVMPGTSAELQAGDIVSLQNLMYGLMLPSGNDASVAIAETVGKIIQKFRKKPSKKCYYQTFIGHMNLFAKQLQIQQSFQNPSGLSMNPNFSSPRALALLTILALQNEEFSKIVDCKQHEIQIKNERFGLVRKMTWVNTNKLLWKGWNGVKTGTTETAGHCLMACKKNLLVSVFNCETLSKRFTQCAHLSEALQPKTENNK